METPESNEIDFKDETRRRQSIFKTMENIHNALNITAEKKTSQTLVGLALLNSLNVFQSATTATSKVCLKFNLCSVISEPFLAQNKTA